MALLRGVHIPCRIHGFTIDKKLQKGAVTGIVYKNAPQNIFHSWVDVYLEKVWYELEGFILDKQYLARLQSIHADCQSPFCGYGVAVKVFVIRLLSLKEIILIFKVKESRVISEYMTARMICFKSITRKCPD